MNDADKIAKAIMKLTLNGNIKGELTVANVKPAFMEANIFASDHAIASAIDLMETNI